MVIGPEATVLTAFVPLLAMLWVAVFCAVMISYGRSPTLWFAVNEFCTAAETVFGVISIFALEKYTNTPIEAAMTTRTIASVRYGKWDRRDPRTGRLGGGSATEGDSLRREGGTISSSVRIWTGVYTSPPRARRGALLIEKRHEDELEVGRSGTRLPNHAYQMAREDRDDLGRFIREPEPLEVR